MVKLFHNKYVKYIILILALIGIPCVIYGLIDKKNELGYRTVRLERGDIASTILATGTLNPVILVQVGSQISGNIKRLYADFNSVVKKNQVIAQIDSMLLKAEVEKARANYKAALANVDKAKVMVTDTRRTLNRYKALVKENLVSQSDVDTAQTNYDSAVAQIEVARAQVDQTRSTLDFSRTRLDYAIIRSPVDGIVLSRNVDVGQTVAASLQAPTLFTIAQDLTEMQVNTSVDEADIGRLEVGQEVTFTVDAYPSEVFKGRVSQIRNAPQVVQNVVTYDVIIEVENLDLKLKPGMTANVSIVVAKKRNVLRIPNAALRYRPYGEEKESRQPKGIETSAQNRVWALLADAKLKSVPVKLGVNNVRYYELTEGDLKEGDNLVVGLSGEKRSSNPGATGSKMYRARRYLGH
ncbi:MAG: HlyD family secretion protein [Desulfobacteraceae bacterium Eth-SRB2]|nr:MAG: HlyD family secretion protein [Desulfobacteraceae bacterium Eth-SRB2]